MTELSTLTTVEAARALARAAVAIVPIGATEQHGPHLELRTDIAIATELARRIDHALGERSILCPPMAYGLSEHHLGFAGTLTLRPATLLAFLRDVCESLLANGITRVVVVNGHGGNTDATRLAAREIGRDLGCSVAHLMWGQVIGDLTSAYFEPGHRYHHACEIETSLAMVCDPALVRPDALQGPAEIAPLDGFTDPPTGRFDVPQPFSAWSANGTLGDPRRASEEVGTPLVEAFVERAVAFTTHFISQGSTGEKLS
ncbi:creatininase family protein [Microbacterium sp. W4I20]|uniref:creatininase family protein n=1 Tax=Microbacterium sp. W4I20 TaxID=3042262 RepID=UPI00277E99A9|nr:creatininase family protein [Microbacterium sp. W4I20]MDQ0727598.1 creatinine amidohydrolase [Microbacterium sp. W4I20]